MITAMNDFLQHILMDWIKRTIEKEIGETIDEEFFNERYEEGIKRWQELYTTESACSFYQEVSAEIKAEWFGRYSKSLIDQAKSFWEDMDDEHRNEFTQWILISRQSED